MDDSGKSDPQSVEAAARKQFEARSHAYGKGHILSQTDDLRLALPHLRFERGQHVLDVATGGGHTAVFFAKLGGHVIASDISEAMLSRTRELADEGGAVLETRCHPADALPYEDGSMDLVTCRVAAHHFPCPASFTMEVARVLKPGGRFLLIDGTVEDGYPIAEEWMHEVESLRDPSHHRLVRPLQWQHLSGHVGMKKIFTEVQPFKQPDLEWYFETAATSPENRSKVKALVESSPEEAKHCFRVQQEEGRWVWWWQRLVFVAQKC